MKIKLKATLIVDSSEKDLRKAYEKLKKDLKTINVKIIGSINIFDVE